MNATLTDDDDAEPDKVADQIIVKRNEITKTHNANFHLHFDGFAFATYVDRSLPIHNGDEVIAIQRREPVAHGIVADSRQHDTTTEFFAVPELGLID